MPPHNPQSDQVTEFDPDLYRGTARDYDRFRVACPDVMIDGLLDAAGPSGHGRLLDLACGTGQITFALAERFAEVWAVDQEPDMIELVRAKAQAIPDTHVHAVAFRAEDLVAPANAFELVAIGNAFHRLRREAVAANSFRWLEPNRWIALLWSTAPWTGDAGWQVAMAAVVERWKTRLGAQARVPAGWGGASPVAARHGRAGIGRLPRCPVGALSHDPRLDGRRAHRVRVLDVGPASRRARRPGLGLRARHPPRARRPQRPS